MARDNVLSQVDRENRLAAAALRLLGEAEWRSLTVASVARSAKLRLPDALEILPSKAALPGAILRMLARETVGSHRLESDSDSPRERLFDAAMSWFDVQQKNAPALKRLYGALQYDPVTVLGMREDILRLSGELLALAEADCASSVRLQAIVFAGVLLRAVSAWRSDEEDMGATMAQLDRDLRGVERLLWPKPPKGAQSPAKTSRAKRKR